MALLPLWAAVFGTLYQLAIVIFGIIKFQSFISFCRGASVAGKYEFVKNALLLSVFSFPMFTVISITFMWVAYDKDWESGVVFVILPILSVLFFLLFLLATVNDISNTIDVGRRGRKRLPQQPPPQLTVSQANLGQDVAVLTPVRQMSPSMEPPLPLQDGY